MAKLLQTLCSALVLFVPLAAQASFDEFADQHSPRNLEIRAQHLTLVLKGEVELELHDLEGEGGPGYDSPTDTRTIGTRSPFVEIDSFWLAPRVLFGEGLAVNSILDFDQRSARVSAVWGDWRASAPAPLTHHVELGYHTPLVAIDRRTERYPLAGAIYWRQPEFHLAYEGELALGPDVTLELGASCALVRPLEYVPVQESTSQPGTINILSYGWARPYSGNGPIWGGRLRGSAFGAFAEAFGFVGSLAAEYGTQALDELYNYRYLPGYSEREGGAELHWYGGRLGYQGHGLFALVEAVASREGLLRRQTAYGQLSYRLRLRPEERLFHAFEPLLRYERYRIEDAAKVQSAGYALRSTGPIYAGTWDYDVLTFALIVQVYRELVRLRVEYYRIEEHNGVPGLGLDDEPFDNDELLLQAEMRF